MKRWICVFLLTGLLVIGLAVSAAAQTPGAIDPDTVKIADLEPISYRGHALEPKPTVTAGSVTLKEGVDYTLSYKDNVEVGSKASVTVTGIGDWEGLSKTAYFQIIKYDIGKEWCTVLFDDVVSFTGMPVTPESITVKISKYGKIDAVTLQEGRDYTIVYEQNVNMGWANFRIVGMGNFCGIRWGEFEITDNREDTCALEGAYNGQADGTLDTEKYHYQEVIWAPGSFTAEINGTTKKHIAFYQLYRVEGENLELIYEKESEYGYSSDTKFYYSIDGVYTGAMDKGGEIYLLTYSWVDSNYSVYSGVCTIFVPAKVPDATQMAVDLVDDPDDFRYAYLTAYGLDGYVGKVTWISSNPEVATIKSGVVTMNTTGRVTFTAQYGELTQKISLNIYAEDLTQGDICHYDTATGKTRVYYNGYILQEGTDYTQSVTTKDGITEVTVTGVNLFEGQLVQQFDAREQAVGHSHGFDNACDTACNSCDYTRITRHVYSDLWSKNKTHHWHACAICGDAADRAEHIPSVEDADTCTECGLFNIPGDLNCDAALDEDDAIWLLRNLLLPEEFPVTENADFDGSGGVNEDDAIYLLRHVLMPEKYPL